MKREEIEHASALLQELKDLNSIIMHGKRITPSSAMHFSALEHYGEKGEISKIYKRHTKRILSLVKEIRDEVQAEIKQL